MTEGFHLSLILEVCRLVDASTVFSSVFVDDSDIDCSAGFFCSFHINEKAKAKTASCHVDIHTTHASCELMLSLCGS